MPSGLCVALPDIEPEHVVIAVVLNGLPETLDQITATEESPSAGVVREILQGAGRISLLPFGLSGGIELGITDVERAGESSLFCGRSGSSQSEVHGIDGDLGVVHHSPNIVICRLHFAALVRGTCRLAQQI